MSLVKIARLMGHSDTRQTMRYVHPGENELLAATEIATRKPESKKYQNRSREGARS